MKAPKTAKEGKMMAETEHRMAELEQQVKDLVSHAGVYCIITVKRTGVLSIKPQLDKD